MPTAVVTGANSGIGHAFAQILIDEVPSGPSIPSSGQLLTCVQGYEVHACDLVIDGPLQSLPCRLHRLDVTSPESVSGLATQLANKPIDVLLNVAGVMTPAEQDSLETTNKAVLTKTFEVNTFGPLLVTQALLPGILAGGEKRVGIVSSRVGSMGDSTLR